MATALHQLISVNRGEIALRFAAEVERKDLSPRGVPRSLLIDHIPLFLDEIIAELERGASVRYTQDAADQSPTARRHGKQRWKIGYDLEAVVREYGILRHVILQSAKAVGYRASTDEFEILAKCLNVGVAEAVGEYVRFRDEELELQRAKLEFLAHASELLVSSLDYRSTLSSVVRLIVPRLADWCAIYLEGVLPGEMPIAHAMPAKVESLRELFQRFPPAPDAAFAFPAVMHDGKPQLVEQVTASLLEQHARSPEHLALLRQLGVRSWIVVPLAVQSTTIGAITLAWSESELHYTESDLLLVGELARRAALAIENARVYEHAQQERSRAEAATRAKDDFVAMVSHELRAPLHAILGWTQLMLTRSLGEPEQRHALEVIERNARAQQALLADLLDTSRALAGALRINPSEVDLRAVIHTTLEDAHQALAEKRIRIHAEFEPIQASIWGDAERLQQIVCNLLSNAIKFTPEAGEIWVGLRRMGEELELTVRDSGIGIAPEFLVRVFDAFAQAGPTADRLRAGLGLGLSIARRLVQLHGGSIEAHSDGIDRGARFIVRLPSYRPPSD